MRLSAALLLIMVALAQLGCGGDEDNESAGSVDARCESAATDVVTPLSNGLEVEGARLTQVYMVQSNDHESIYFVSGEVDGPDYEDPGDIATFASESQFGGGAIYAVDDLANELSTLRDGREVADLSADDDGVELSRSCAST